jgi:hypothetical protein
MPEPFCTSWFISRLGLRYFAESKTTHQLRSFKQAALTALSWLDYSPASTQGAKVAYLVYREHTIVTSASQDEITQQWLPVISISWMKNNGRLDVHFLRIRPGALPEL